MHQRSLSAKAANAADANRSAQPRQKKTSNIAQYTIPLNLN